MRMQPNILIERENELVTVVSPELLRTGHVWVPTDLRWYRRRVTLALLRTALGITGHVAQKAVEVWVCGMRVGLQSTG